jgi:hypothetical protein
MAAGALARGGCAWPRASRFLSGADRSGNGDRGGEVGGLPELYGDQHDAHLHRKGGGHRPPVQQPTWRWSEPQVEAGIAARVHYTCGDPLFDVYEGPYSLSLTDHWGGISIKNGETFTLSLSPFGEPSGFPALFGCWTGPLDERSELLLRLGRRRLGPWRSERR